MSQCFLFLFNQSLAAGWLILFLLLLRPLIKKAPAWISCLLWGGVAMRLLFRFGETSISLIPSGQTIQSGPIPHATPLVNSGFSTVDRVLTQTISGQLSGGASLWDTLITAASWIWLAGLILLSCWSLASYLRLRKKTQVNLLYRDNLYFCDGIDTPFILGYLHPKVFLPSYLAEEDLAPIIAHEQAHLDRFDPCWKLIGFVLLNLFWFHPLVWLAFSLFCRDLERACDETVIAKSSSFEAKAYCQALLDCSSPKFVLSASPLAFGEIDVKARIESVLCYKKPTFRILAISLAACAIIAVCFLSNPYSATADNVLNERGYRITQQEMSEVTFTIPRSVFSEEIFTKEGKDFDVGEVIVFQEGGTTVSLVGIRSDFPLRETHTMIFTFRLTHQPSKEGWMYIPISKTEHGSWIQPAITIVEDACIIAGNEIFVGDTSAAQSVLQLRGVSEYKKIAFYISPEACKSTDGNLQFSFFINKLFYAKQN